MIERDYIMKMVRFFAQAMLKILFNKDTKNYTEAYHEIKKAGKMISGFTLEQMKTLTSEDVMLLFDMKKESEVMKVIYTAKLLSEEGRILEEEKRTDEALASYSKAIEFFKLIPDKPEFKEHITEDIKFLQRKIN